MSQQPNTGAVAAVAADSSSQRAEQINATRPKGSSPVAANPNTGQIEPNPTVTSEQQTKAEAIAQQKEEGIYQTPGGTTNSAIQAIQSAKDNLGITYVSGGGGGSKTGGLSERDLYVANILNEYSKGFISGPPKDYGNSPEQRLGDLLGQVGLAYNKQTRTITDPLMEKINRGDIGGGDVSEGLAFNYHDISSPIKAFTASENAKKLANPSYKIQSPTSENVQPFQNDLSGLTNNPDKGVSTKKSEGLGSSLGQEATGYIKKDSSGNIIPEYSSEQVASLISSKITNKEYSGNTSFLAGNINTENSTGPEKMGEAKTLVKPTDISSTQPSDTNPFVISGGHVLPAGLVFTPTKADIDRANLARAQQVLENINQKNNDIALGNALIDISNQQIREKNNKISLGNGLIDLSNKQNGVNSNRLIGSELDFVLPNEKTQLGMNIDWKNPATLQLATTLQGLGLPLSQIPEVIASSVFGLVGLAESLPTTSHTIADIISKGGYNKETLVKAAQNLYTPEAIQFIQAGKINPNESPSLVGGIASALTGKGLTGFQSGYGLPTDIVSVGTDAFLTLFGLQEAVPLRYTKAIVEAGQGLTKDISLGSALTVGYKEGGSGRILIYKSPTGEISFGTPEPSKYLPEQIPTSMTGRGFTRSEGGGLVNKLLNSEQVLAYQEQQNILTSHDVELIKAGKEAVPLIVKAPVTVFHSTFGTQPLETVLTGAETTALKDIITTGQQKLGLGSQYGSFADIPFVPGKVNVGDLDLAVSSPAQQKLIGTFAQDMLNKATGEKVSFTVSSNPSKTPGSPLDLVIDNQLFGVNTMKAGEPSRLFKYEEGAVFLYQKGKEGRTKIIDLPIKGLNEEGGSLGNTYHQVFGVEEPTKTFKIENIKTLTPHYNTVRRLTTVTRQGNKEMKSAIPGFGLTTKFGDYTGMEIGRMKDAARSYRGIILAANEYRKVGKIPQAEKLENAGNIIKRRFQHIYNFNEALNEIKGETVFNRLPESPRLESSIINKSVLPISKEPLISKASQNNNQEKRNIKTSINNLKTNYNIKEKLPEKSLRPSISESETEIYKSISPKSLAQNKSEVKGFRPSQKSSIKSNYNTPVKSFQGSIIPSNKSVAPSRSPASLTPLGKLGIITPILTAIPFGKPSGTLGFEKNIINEGLPKGKPKELLVPNWATKPDERVLRKEVTRFNYIGNSTESTLVGLYNRQETIYGKARTAKLSAKDYLRTTKGFPKLVSTKTKGLISKKTTVSKKENKKNKIPKF